MTTASNRMKSGRPLVWKASTVSVFALGGLMHGHGYALADDSCPFNISCIIVDEDSGHGSVTVENRTWPDGETRRLYVGNTSQGTLNIRAGGVVESGPSYIGYENGATGIVSVTGDASDKAQWTATGSLFVSDQGKGILDIGTNGEVYSESHIQVAWEPESEGIIRVQGENARLESSHDLNLGLFGTGVLEISDGGNVITGGNAKIGHLEHGDGTAIVSGSGARWDISSYLVLGDNTQSGSIARGTLTISEGGVVSAGDGSGGLGNVHIGRYSRATGTINIGAASGADAVAGGTLNAARLVFGAGEGTLVFNHTAEDSEGLVFAPSIRGSGVIQHENGHTILTGDSSNRTGATTISGGTLSVGDMNSMGKLGGSVTVTRGGTLAGTGTVGNGAGGSGSGTAGIVTVTSGGTLAPGNSLNNSVGTLTINGDLMLEQGAIVHYRLGRPDMADSPLSGVSDRIEISGDLRLDGTLNLAQSGHPDDGTAGLGYYRLMTYGGNLTDGGLEIGTVPDADTHHYHIMTADSGNVDLFIQTLDDDTLQHWQGGDGNWEASNPQWLNRGGEVPAVWSGNHAVFKNEPGSFKGGTITVDGEQGFQGLQFVDDGYRLEGTGALHTGDANAIAEVRVLSKTAHIATTITGDGGMAKTEKGTLVLSGENTYRGGTYLRDGTLSVSSDANLGHSDGTLHFDGGILHITDSDFARLDREITWSNQGGGFDIAYYNDNKDYTFTVSSDLTGGGNLVKRGAGALRLTGINAYSNTLIQEGSLYGDAQSISGNIHIVDGVNGGVFFEQNNDAVFAGDFSSDDAKHVTAVKAGPGVLTLTGNSSVHWWIERGELATSAERFSGSAALNRGSALTFHQDQNGIFDNTFEGLGQINKTGAGQLLLTGNSSTFLGTTTISDGTLSVGGADGTGKLGGAITIENGGTLAGTGTVGTGLIGSGNSRIGTVTVAPGGTLAPGNSIGTLTVDGDLAFKSSSRYAVEVDPEGTASDHVDVRGKATLDGGSVVHIGAQGSYRPESSYRILSAGTGLDGAFDDVTSNFAFLTPTLEYDYDDFTVDLTLQRNNTSIAALARTPNQVATALALESLPQNSKLLQHVLTLPDDTPASTFDTLSGEVYASVVSALHLGNATARSLPLAHLRANLMAGKVPGALLAQAGSPSVPAAALPQSAALPLWAEVIGNWQRLDGDGNAADLKQSTHGVFVGGDHEIGTGWRLGAALGYTDSRIRVRDRNSHADVESYSATVYGGKAFDLGAGQLNILAGAAYSRHSIETDRQATLGDWNQSLKADYRAHTQQVFAELGYAMPLGHATLEPFAGLAWSELRTRSFTETGGTTALSGQRQREDTTTSTLGLRASTDLEFGHTQGHVYGSVGWRHAFGRITPQSTLRFDAGRPFTVAGTPIARDSAVLEVGAELTLSPKARIGLAYNGQLGDGSRDHAGRINVQWRF